MTIAGYQKNSLIDFPGRIACVVFFAGCNMNCWFCHNRQILGPVEGVDEAEFWAFLSKRRGMLDGVVLSGGEPTLHRGLWDFVERVKAMGYAVKLDTNGSQPQVLKRLLAEGMIDYVAMDVKAPLEKYASATCADDDLTALLDSIEIIKAGGADYEFRTTFLPILTPADIGEIARTLKGAKKYIIQPYRHENAYAEILGAEILPHPPEVFDAAKLEAEKYLENVIIRGKY